MDFFLEFRKKNLSRTQNSPEDFPRTRPDTLSFPFLLTISRPPPGVSQNKKSPSHFCKALPARTPPNSDPTTRNRENIPKNPSTPKAYLFKTLPPDSSRKMFSLGSLKLSRDPARINLLLNQASPIILTSLMSLVIFHGYLLIQQSNGGSDLVSADIPKSLILLNGQNPYSTQPWASPYPPLLLLTVSGVIRLTSLFTSQSSLILISQQIRLLGLFADAAVALIIYLSLRSRTRDALQALIPARLFLALPAISTSPLYFFHSDTFANPILPLATLTLIQHLYFIGTTLLATATILKIHPILAL